MPCSYHQISIITQKIDGRFECNKKLYIKESMVMGKESKGSDEILITASIFPDAEEVTEVLGKNPDIKAQEFLIWTEIDKINNELPYFKRIKKITIRSEEFEKTTGKKIKRNSAANQA